MNFDVFTIAALVDELNTQLLGGKVQDSLELGNDAIGLEIYSNHRRQYLMLSADPQTARVQLLGEKLRRGVETPSPLGLMLRRNIEDARVFAIRQPPYERLIQFTFQGPEGEFELIAEPMERRSNLLLVRDGTIMDCLRRVGPHENRVRLSLPGHAYVPPPPQSGKLAPDTLDLPTLKAALARDPALLAWRTLTGLLLGYSPLLARETVYRAAGRLDARAEAVDAADLFEIVREITAPLLARQWEPGVCEENGTVTAYSVYEITHLRGWRPVEQVSQALDAYYGASEGIEAYDTAKQPVFAVIADAREKVQRKLDALRRSERDESERERLRQSGELILAYQYQITAGQGMLSAQYDFDKPPLDIKIDPKLTPLENAKQYFASYEHAKRAMAEVPQLIEQTQQELDYLDQLRADLSLAANWPEIGEVQDALQGGGYWQGPKTARPKGARSGALKVTAPDGTLIWIGRNSRQNDDVTFVKGRPEDTWLHVRGMAGAHVIIKSGGRTIKPEVLRRAAALAAYYSAARTETHVLVDVTERRHVRKIKGGKPGMVTYRNETVLEVKPEDAV